jgi:hypothetical protein
VLAGGAHVSLGGVLYLLDESVEPCYTYRPRSLLAERVDFSAAPGRHSLNPGVIQVAMDDWAGGEGNKFYDPADPTVYWKGLCNPRRPGQVSGPPTRTDSNSTPTDTLAAGLYTLLEQQGAKLWAAAYRRVWHTTDASTWTEINPAYTTGAQEVHSLAHDHEFLYIGTSDPATGGTTRRVYRITSGAGSATDLGACGVTPIGLVRLTTNIYGWNGVTLRTADATATPPLTWSTAYNTGGGDLAGYTYYADAIASDNSILMLIGYDGQTEIHQYQTSGALWWTLPPGFTGTAFTYALGVVYVAGLYGGRSALFAKSLVSDQPLFLGYFRYGQTDLTPRAMAPGNGAQVLIGMQTGEVFIYDAELNSISQLDARTIANHQLRAVATFKDKRVAAWQNTVADADLSFSAWSRDDNISSTTAGVMESGIMHFGIPEHEKRLTAVHLTHDSISGSESIDIHYALDDTTDSPTYTLLGTSSTSSDEWKTIDVASSNLKFRSLRVKATTNSGAVLNSAVAEAMTTGYVREWELVLRIQDETGVRRPSSKQRRAGVLRDNIRSAVDTKNVVVFKDGYGDQDAGDSTDINVVIVAAEDEIGKNGQGRMRVLVRAVP